MKPKVKAETNSAAIPPRGRPRSFSTDKALDAALKVFWRKGYEGTTLPDLERATGINRPSLYAAFGNKEALFKKVLDRYAEGPAAYGRQALEAATAREVAERILRGAIEMQCDRQNPRGCLLVQGALACGEEAEPVRREMIVRRRRNEELVRRRFERAIAEGDLPCDADAAGLAQYLVTVVRGMAVQAAGGARREDLEHVAAIALRAWPTRKGGRRRRRRATAGGAARRAAPR